MLPLTVLRRLDCVLAPTKARVLEEYKASKDKGKGILDAKLRRITGVPFYNTSKYSFEELKGDSAAVNTLDNFGFVFDSRVSELFIDRLDQNGSMTSRFLNDPEFKKAVAARLVNQVYERIRAEPRITK